MTPLLLKGVVSDRPLLAHRLSQYLQHFHLSLHQVRASVSSRIRSHFWLLQQPKVEMLLISVAEYALSGAAECVM